MSFIENTNIQLGGHIGFSKKILPSIEDAIENNMKITRYFYNFIINFKQIKF